MLSILRKARLKDKSLRVLLLGLDNAGKTTIVKQVLGEDINTVSPTLGFQIRTITHEGYGSIVIVRGVNSSWLIHVGINLTYVSSSHPLLENVTRSFHVQTLAIELVEA